MGEKPTGRLGLLGMNERVRHVDGVFSIESSAGKGTRVKARVPFESATKHSQLGATTGSLLSLPAGSQANGAGDEGDIREAG
jgi:hypothetical protein